MRRTGGWTARVRLTKQAGFPINVHSYFDKKFPSSTNYEAKDEKTGTTLIAMQPLVANRAYIPQMKAMCVPFHMVYGGFMCCQRLQSDRPKWRGSLAEVSQTSLCRTVSKAIQFHSEKCTAPAILAVTWLFLGVGQAIIPHLKEDIRGYLLI